MNQAGFHAIDLLGTCCLDAFLAWCDRSMHAMNSGSMGYPAPFFRPAYDDS